MRFICLSLLWASLFFATPVASAERRVALVVGNDAYLSVPQVPNAKNDAKAMAALLREQHFDVEEHQNLGNEAFRAVVRSFLTRTEDADLAVVYYAGHGIEIDGINYLIPTDARLKTDIDATDEAVSLDRVLQMLEPVRRLRLVILDACRDNPFSAKMKRTTATRSLGRGLTQVEPSKSNTLIAFAAKAGSLAEDGSGFHSPFTAALLKHIAEPGLDIRIALGRVRDDVLDSTGSKQEPFVYGSLGGSIVTLSSQTAVAEKQDANEALRDFAIAHEAAKVETWDAFIHRYKDGNLNELARKERDRLTVLQSALANRAPPGGPSSSVEGRIRVDIDDVSRMRIAQIAERSKMPLPQYSFSAAETKLSDRFYRFLGVWASSVGFNGGPVQAMLIIFDVSEKGNVHGHWIIGAPPPSSRDLLPARSIPILGSISGNKLLFSTQNADIEAALDYKGQFNLKVVQTAKGTSSRVGLRPLWTLTGRHSFPATSANSRRTPGK
jgi:hypothetical protein